MERFFENRYITEKSRTITDSALDKSVEKNHSAIP